MSTKLKDLLREDESTSDFDRVIKEIFGKDKFVIFKSDVTSKQYVVLCDGKIDNWGGETVFSGIVIVGAEGTHIKKGHRSSSFLTDRFNPFEGELEIK